MIKILTFLGFSLSFACSRPLLHTNYTAQVRKTHEATGTSFVIASPGTATGLAAKKIFDQGGNLVDAAIAASFAVSVERPQSTGLGGGGFMLLKLANSKEVVSVDFREQAPLHATEGMYLDKDNNVVAGLSTDGVKAAAVPGLVAGLIEIHQKYGKLPLPVLIQPAIELAENGFNIYPHLAKALAERKSVLEQFPSSKKIFFHANGELLQEGDLLQQPELAKTLRSIAENGKDGFYKGWVARAIVEQQKKHGGLITEKDLLGYEVKFRTPVQGMYKDYTVYSMPPPSSGGIHLIQILNILEHDSLGRHSPLSPKSIHLTSAAMQLAFADRAKYLGDPDFVNVPTTGLTSKAYAKKLRQSIAKNKAKSSKNISHGDPYPHESDQTTHISLMDKEGNVVSTTQTVNGYMGAGVVVEGAGFLLNNEMDDFSAKPGVPNMFGALGGKENAVQPKKRPLSSMTPTIVTKNGSTVLAIGSPGGTRIISCVLLSMLNYLEYDLSLFDSLSLARYHHQWAPDEIRLDSGKFPKAVEKDLESMGYKINHSDYKCSVQAVAKEKNFLKAASDPRDVGLAIGGH